MLTRLGDACTVMTCKLVIVAVSWFEAWVGGVRHDIAILSVTPHTQVVEGHIPTRVGAIYCLEFDAEPSRKISSRSSPSYRKGTLIKSHLYGGSVASTNEAGLMGNCARNHDVC